MRRSLRDRLTYANVMSTIAVFAALGGTSYALTLPRNSVGGEQLRSNSVGATEIRRRAVGSIEIRNRSIRLRDIATTTRESLQDATGTTQRSVLSERELRRRRVAWAMQRASHLPATTAPLVHFSRSAASCVRGGDDHVSPRGNESRPAGWRADHSADHRGRPCACEDIRLGWRVRSSRPSTSSLPAEDGAAQSTGSRRTLSTISLGIRGRTRCSLGLSGRRLRCPRRRWLLLRTRVLC